MRNKNAVVPSSIGGVTCSCSEQLFLPVSAVKAIELPWIYYMCEVLQARRAYLLEVTGLVSIEPK